MRTEALPDKAWMGLSLSLSPTTLDGTSSFTLSHIQDVMDAMEREPPQEVCVRSHARWSINN